MQRGAAHYEVAAHDEVSAAALCELVAVPVPLLKTAIRTLLSRSKTEDPSPTLSDFCESTLARCASCSASSRSLAAAVAELTLALVTLRGSWWHQKQPNGSVCGHDRRRTGSEAWRRQLRVDARLVRLARLCA